MIGPRAATLDRHLTEIFYLLFEGFDLRYSKALVKPWGRSRLRYQDIKFRYDQNTRHDAERLFIGRPDMIFTWSSIQQEAYLLFCKDCLLTVILEGVEWEIYVICQNFNFDMLWGESSFEIKVIMRTLLVDQECWHTCSPESGWQHHRRFQRLGYQTSGQNPVKISLLQLILTLEDIIICGEKDYKNRRTGLKSSTDGS